MGCDIHGTLERKVNGKWIMINRLDDNVNFRDRNYRRFARLAGVRGDGQKPKGVPDDVSESTALFIDDWGSDGHSHSWMSVAEAKQIFLETDYRPSEWSILYPEEHYFGVDNPDEIDIHRIVFFFDN